MTQARHQPDEESRGAAPRTFPAGESARRALLRYAAFAVVVGLLVALWLLARPLAILFAAVVIACALAPVVRWLEPRMPRVLAVLIVYLGLLLVLGIVGVLVLPPLLQQAQESIERIPELLVRARRLLGRVDLVAEERLLQAAQSAAEGLSGTVIALPLMVLSATLEAALVIVLSIYWLLAMPALREFTLSLFPDSSRKRAGDLLGEMGQTIGGYVRGTALDGLILGVAAYAGYMLIGVSYPLVLALLAGLGGFVPFIGPLLAVIPAVLLALLDSPAKALVVIGFYIGLQQLEGNLLLPNILGRQADIPPLLVVFAFFAGGSVGGVLGAIVAIPFAAMLRVFFLRVVAPTIRHWSGAQRPAREE